MIALTSAINMAPHSVGYSTLLSLLVFIGTLGADRKGFIHLFPLGGRRI